MQESWNFQKNVNGDKESDVNLVKHIKKLKSIEADHKREHIYQMVRDQQWTNEMFDLLDFCAKILQHFQWNQKSKRFWLLFYGCSNSSLIKILSFVISSWTIH